MAASRWRDYWVHNGFVDMGAEKMSKCLGNVITAGRAAGRTGIKGETLRLALLSAHYRQPLPWTESLIAQSKAMLDRLVSRCWAMPSRARSIAVRGRSAARRSQHAEGDCRHQRVPEGSDGRSARTMQFFQGSREQMLEATRGRTRARLADHEHGRMVPGRAATAATSRRGSPTRAEAKAATRLRRGRPHPRGARRPRACC